MTAGTASPSAGTDRSDFTHVLVSGTRIGAAIGAAVIAYLLVSRQVPAGLARAVLQALIVLTGAVAASLLPARWAMARGPQGMAGAAAIGLWGTIVFMATDIVVLRPVKAYPWTWDAVGGGSSWWYLPVWWMLGTFVAWMGGLLTAGRAARGGPTTLVALATPVLGGTVAITAAAQLAHLGVYLPVAAGAAYALTLTVLAVVAIARKA
ncbi:MAG TPA: hypothetical protein VGJ83_08925 [Gemmatimonadales bacterium]